MRCGDPVTPRPPICAKAMAAMGVSPSSGSSRGRCACSSCSTASTRSLHTTLGHLILSGSSSRVRVGLACMHPMGPKMVVTLR